MFDIRYIYRDTLKLQEHSINISNIVSKRKGVFNLGYRAVPRVYIH